MHWMSAVVDTSEIWKNISVRTVIKLRFMKVLIRVVAAYSCESRALNKEDEKKMAVRVCRLSILVWWGECDRIGAPASSLEDHGSQPSFEEDK